MAKPLGPKSLLIRETIKAHPNKGNTALAALINDSDARQEDRIKVTANDIAQQRQAMKKAKGAAERATAVSNGGTKSKGGPGRKPGRKSAQPTAA